ncbi:acid phosphatase 1-like [Tripterygium wilfordii]|uniref:acid phosphatase 1-like n=1 Tax=Tripterygium wilfordii TaxID=458696 RepID=UPI0018F81DF3|nr:acid phosphatase 1-like [Tripterygium wilfordii]
MSSSNQSLLFSVTLFALISSTISRSIIQMPIPSHRNIHADDEDLLCDSWRLSVETNNMGSWSTVPPDCVTNVKDYMTGERYNMDTLWVTWISLSFAGDLKLAGDGKDAWILGVDDALLSNLPYYQDHGYGSESFNETSYNEWVDLANAPAVPSSPFLYWMLQRYGFTIFLLSGRDEFQRKVTIENLSSQGFSGWEDLILRQDSDQGVPAVVYKSQKRLELVNKGYRIHGVSGSQWSDLLGSAVGERSFKIPNPLYNVS